MKAANLYCNWKLMVMATNLYSHCWFAGARLTSSTCSSCSSSSLSFFLFVAHVLLFHSSTHTQLKKFAQRQKKQNLKSKVTTKSSNKGDFVGWCTGGCWVTQAWAVDEPQLRSTEPVSTLTPWLNPQGFFGVASEHFRYPIPRFNQGIWVQIYHFLG